MFPYFLLHTDTPYRLFEERLVLDSQALQCKIDATATATVVYAIWSDAKRHPKENFIRFFKIRERLCQALMNKILPRNFSCILSVEGASLLEERIERLSLLSALGVRTLTPLWSGEDFFGGAWNTDVGLTEFGKRATEEAIRHRILPDISHASRRSAEQIADVCERFNVPVFASHSNSYSVCTHGRNLTDRLFQRIVSTHGLLGLCFAPEHLTTKGVATLTDLLLHTEHFLSLGGENVLALGSDFDGIEQTPVGLSSTADLPRLCEAYSRIGYPDSLICKILYLNAQGFFTNFFSDSAYHFFKNKNI